MVTIGLLTYKRNEDIVSTINQFSNSLKHDVELIIVDNNEVSQESFVLDCVEIPEKWSLKYFFDGVNKGVSGGRGVVFDNSKYKRVIFLDDDVVICSIDSIIDDVNFEFDSDEFLGCIAFNVIDNQTKVINNYEFPHKNKNLKGLGDFYTYYFIGAGHAILKDVYNKVGGYASDMGLYGMEEVDLSYRIINYGFTIKYLSLVHIYHKKSPSGRISNHQSIYNSFHNKVMIASKHLKFRFFISHCIAWGWVYFRHTYDFKNIIKVFRKSIKIRKDSKDCKFNSIFYRYCKSVEAWLWW